MKTCDYCKKYADFDAYKVGDKIFCSKTCARKTLFCRHCLSSTVEVPYTDVNKVFWDWASERKEGFDFGPAFGKSSEKICPRCGSAVQRLWLCFFIPIIPLGKYCILPVKKDGKLNWTFLVRKLKDKFI